MKTKKFLGCLAALAMTLPASAQVAWDTNGNTVTGTSEWFGADASSTAPLRVETRVNQPIEWYTSAIRRITLLPDATYSIGGFPPQAKNGSLLLCPDVDTFYANGAPGPYTALHLAAATNNAQQTGYRSNMRNGITMTGNNDQMYIGQLFYSQDYTDAAIVWSDNPGEWLADRLTFNFTSGYNSAVSSGYNSYSGLQTMLIQPASSGQEAFVGLGDFDAANEVPEQRLDVLDGKVRIRQLPADATSTSSEYVTVNTTTGVLEHRPLPPSAIANCEWSRDVGALLVRSGFGAAGSGGSCPDRSWTYGVGAGSGASKFTIQHNESDRILTGTGTGLDVQLTTNASSGSRVGLRSTLNPVSGTTVPGAISGDFLITNPSGSASGVRSRVNMNAAGASTSSVFGHEGLVTTTAGTVASSRAIYGKSVVTGGTVTNAVGVYAQSEIYAPAAVTNNYGIYASVVGTGSGVTYSGLFAGAPISVASIIYPSDEHLKTEISEMEDPLALLMQLRPKAYQYRTEEYPQIGLPEGTRYGFIAQEVQEVFPQFTRSVHQPAETDSSGNVVVEAVDYLGLNTADMTGILVASVQAQQAQLDAERTTNAAQMEQVAALQQMVQEQQQRMSELEHLLATCCANPEGVRSLPQGSNEPAGVGNDLTGTDKLRIQPNPFNAHTTVYYTLDRGGRTQLLANSSDGRDLCVLQEASLEAGSYQFEWDTTALAPGMYYVTLLVDGQPVVKKAVKVDR